MSVRRLAFLKGMLQGARHGPHRNTVIFLTACAVPHHSCGVDHELPFATNIQGAVGPPGAQSRPLPRRSDRYDLAEARYSA